ncbi:uracil-DNA glycosylase [Candidatus Woesebacteria bacterium CG22_combo_CG10-13_8_21_14_all_39_10]|uniref:Type-4 uracil-DNA glycosylase n=4 Tax=Candidatus Woeseibacteriota TaxID=1752722 RepID=A0A2M7XA24_9BACT|nr:MAG: uracil-DNA glycosylase [Candidatus Woesebacteria bacterium CG22_combo_CG10-13_8_21_14_all_39_10]PIU72026.1 MAG: uracil-DNA glycosylase [Candidatus Woesebacteria bacterium CG06_land_8_20_14_3_00_39_27]PIZ46612.1 MAG: uracil-DNA glycosylase [Candidatus Woesebacteria bacterium CG_4_10_14_0_2_um_filter_39_14]PJA43000.1 MAG: uracil-DNA glycosylase [Candidatus Woesebacteria bacterium CG_4_9_14_3_um_filter_39_10]
MDKALELRKIKEDMENDRNLPLIAKPEDVIPGDGNADSEIVFIGEAGGYHESIQRKPFVGNAGMLLNRLLASIHLPRGSVYITNMVKTRPPENRDPLPEELEAYSRYLDRELEVIKPKVVVTLGRFSMAKFLPNARISGVHGKKFEVNWNGKNILVVPMYHPAAALRNGAVMEQIKNDFLKIPEYLKEAENKEREVKTEQTQLF